MRFSEFFGFSSGKSKKKKEPKATKTTSASEKHKKKMAALAKYDAKRDGKKNGTKPAASNKPAASKKATPNKKYDLSPAGRKAATKAREDSYSKTKPKAKAKPKPKPQAKAETKAKPKRAKVTGKGSKLTADGKANVTREQLQASGLSLRGYMNQWNKSGKRPTASAKKARPAKSRQGKGGRGYGY